MLTNRTPFLRRRKSIEVGLTYPAMLLLLAFCGCPVEPEETSKPNTPTPDAGPALRQLETYKLFGEMPIDNRVLDPQFALLNGSGWGAYGSAGAVTLVRNHLPQTPMRQVALEVQKTAATQWVVAMGQVKSQPGPLKALIWMGREAGASDPGLNLATAGIIGLFDNQGVKTAELQFDSSYPPTQMDNIEWKLFSAQLEDGPIGWCDFLVTDEAGSKLYLTSPIVVAADTDVSWHMAKRLPPAKLRAVSTPEKSALAQRKQRFMRQNSAHRHQAAAVRP